MIKANKLMIGDWICIYHSDSTCLDYHESFKVTEVRDGGVMVEGFSDRYEDEYLYPIPLTAEILEKNGFCSILSLYYYNEEYDILLDKTKGPTGHYTKCLDKNIQINYVHELQHALRLCGLNDFAANFKI